MIKRKKIANPKFQSLETQGQVLSVSVVEEKAKASTTYIVESEWLQLRMQSMRVTCRLNEARNAIVHVEIELPAANLTYGAIENLSDCLAFIEQLKVKQYWKDSELQLLLYTLFRFIICTISGVVLQIKQLAADQAEAELAKAIIQQKQLVNLLLFTLESVNLDSSSYVVNSRASYLLRIGLNPREQYDNKDVLKTCKQLLKLLHPDMPLGSTTYFKFIGEAQKYFK